MADGVNKSIIFKKEVTWGVKPTATGGKYVPRINASYQLEKDAYVSASINTSQQARDSRHGTRRATGSHEAELQCGAFSEFQAAALRRDFNGTATTGALTTIAATSSGFSRTGGSFITDGFRKGMIVNVTGFTAPATANNTRYVLIDVQALTLTARKVRQSEVAIVTKAAGDSVTVVLAGKMTFTPQTGHTNDSFTIEEFHSDIPMSNITLGQQVNSMSFSMTPNAMVTTAFAFLGKDAEAASATQYFTSPTAVPATGTMSSADGLALVGGVATCKITSFSVNVENNISQESVIACQGIGGRSRGKVLVTGSMSALLEDETYIDMFNDEVETTLFLSLNGTDGSTFAMYMPRVKFNSTDKDDGEKNIIITIAFDALEYVGSDAATEKTTLILSDSTL